MCVRAWKDPREKRLTLRFFLFCLSLSPALNSPQVEEREDSKDAGQNEESRDLQNAAEGGGGRRRAEKHE
jgi:hypothetical protein